MNRADLQAMFILGSTSVRTSNLRPRHRILYWLLHLKRTMLGIENNFVTGSDGAMKTQLNGKNMGGHHTYCRTTTNKNMFIL